MTTRDEISKTKNQDNYALNKPRGFFYVGTVHQHPKSWIIVGLFYPLKPRNHGHLDYSMAKRDTLRIPLDFETTVTALLQTSPPLGDVQGSRAAKPNVRQRAKRKAATRKKRR